MRRQLNLLRAVFGERSRRRFLLRALNGDRRAGDILIGLARQLDVDELRTTYLSRYQLWLGTDAGSIATRVLADHAYQVDLLDRLSRMCPPNGQVFVNVGANIGTACLNAHALGFRRFLAIEPVAANLDKLRRNLDQLKADSLVEIAPLAAGRTAETRSIFLNQTSSGRHSFRRNFGDGSEEVKVERLDAILPAAAGVVYIDAEGSEAEIVLGAERYLAEYCEALCVELTPAELTPDELEILSHRLRDSFDHVECATGRSYGSVSEAVALSGRGQIDLLLWKDFGGMR